MQRLLLTLLAVMFVLPHGARASDLNSISVQGQYTDVADYVENAIINKGLTIDYSGEVNRMLERTGADVGSTKSIYTGAKFFLFCSATLSREMMEADARTMGLCPFSVYVYEAKAEPGVVHVGYRRPGQGANEEANKVLAKVDELLESIITEATE